MGQCKKLNLLLETFNISIIIALPPSSPMNAYRRRLHFFLFRVQFVLEICSNFYVDIHYLVINAANQVTTLVLGVFVKSSYTFIGKYEKK